MFSMFEAYQQQQMSSLNSLFDHKFERFDKLDPTQSLNRHQESLKDLKSENMSTNQPYVDKVISLSFNLF